MTRHGNHGVIYPITTIACINNDACLDAIKGVSFAKSPKAPGVILGKIGSHFDLDRIKKAILLKKKVNFCTIVATPMIYPGQ